VSQLKSRRVDGDGKIKILIKISLNPDGVTTIVYYRKIKNKKIVYEPNLGFGSRLHVRKVLTLLRRPF